MKLSKILKKSEISDNHGYLKSVSIEKFFVLWKVEMTDVTQLNNWYLTRPYTYCIDMEINKKNVD